MLFEEAQCKYIKQKVFYETFLKQNNKNCFKNKSFVFTKLFHFTPNPKRVFVANFLNIPLSITAF